MKHEIRISDVSAKMRSLLNSVLKEEGRRLVEDLGNELKKQASQKIDEWLVEVSYAVIEKVDPALAIRPEVILSMEVPD